MTEPVDIIVQGTPNPNAAKFTLNRTVATRGTTYRLPAPPPKALVGGPATPKPGESGGAQAGDPATADTPWAQQLLAIPGVTQAFAMNNFISVTKRPEADWNQVGPQVEAVLRQAFA